LDNFLEDRPFGRLSADCAEEFSFGQSEEDKERGGTEMDNEVKPTWRLAWGLWWRFFLITLGVYAIIFLILLLVVGIPFLSYFTLGY
jgi:hypothetical protein